MTGKLATRFFFRGVTNNKAVVAAFEKVVGRKIQIPPHFDVTGAIGAAVSARRSMVSGQKTRFKGFGIRNAAYDITRFVCQSCTNHCEIRKVKIEGIDKASFMEAGVKNMKPMTGKRIQIIFLTCSKRGLRCSLATTPNRKSLRQPR